MLKQWANNNRDRIMNKHEVIEILWDGLKAASHYGENYVNGINVAEQLYARIAPEFSEETEFEVRCILAEFSTVTAMSQDEAVDKIKRLFEGEKTIVVDCLPDSEAVMEFLFRNAPYDGVGAPKYYVLVRNDGILERKYAIEVLPGVLREFIRRGESPKEYITTKLIDKFSDEHKAALEISDNIENRIR